MLWLKKDIPKMKNKLFQSILQNILENQTFQRTPKFIFADFHKMNFMKGIFILVKVDQMNNILKSASHYLLVKRWRWDWMIKVFAGVYSWMAVRLLRLPFIKRQASSRKIYNCRERVWYSNIDGGKGKLVQRSKKIEMSDKSNF